MRLICSPVLSDDDYDAMRGGYDERADAAAGQAIRNDLRQDARLPGPRQADPGPWPR